MDEEVLVIVQWVSLVVLALLAAGTLTTTSALVFYFVASRRKKSEAEIIAPKTASWLRIPDVHIHAKSCPVDVSRIRGAIAFWKGLGYPIGDVYETNSLKSVRGVILVVGKRSAETSAVTHISGRNWSDGVDLAEVVKGDHYCRPDEVVSVFADGQIDHAVIIVPPPVAGRNMDLVLIHLIGHALGFSHAGAAPPGKKPKRIRGHVMSALLSESGWAVDGLASSGFVQDGSTRKSRSSG